MIVMQEEECQGDDPLGEPDAEDPEERLHQEVVRLQHHLVGPQVAQGVAALQQEGRHLQVGDRKGMTKVALFPQENALLQGDSGGLRVRLG